MDFFELVGPNRAVQLFGVKLVGVNADNGGKLLFSLVFVALLYLLNFGARRLASAGLRQHETSRFW